MFRDKKIALLFGLSIAGLLFSGYLSGLKFFTETCAFNEPCPYFLGYPACYYGFAMFLALVVISFLSVVGRISSRKGARGVCAVSVLGILFAGYFTLKEIPVLFGGGISAYVLGLPTCALGLIFYILIFAISLAVLVKNKALSK